MVQRSELIVVDIVFKIAEDTDNKAIRVWDLAAVHLNFFFGDFLFFKLQESIQIKSFKLLDCISVSESSWDEPWNETACHFFAFLIREGLYGKNQVARIINWVG